MAINTVSGCQRRAALRTHYVCCRKFSHFCLFPSWWNLWEVRKFCHLFRPGRKKKGFGGLRCHFKALSWSNFPLSLRAGYLHTALSASWKILGRGLPAIKCALNRSITEADHWLRLALVSNNTVCYLQFQMTDREMGTINTFYLLTHSYCVSLRPILPLVMVWSSDPSLSHWTLKVFNLAELWLCFLFLLSWEGGKKS